MNNKKKEAPLQMADTPDEGWFNGKEYVPFEKMSTSYLRRAHMHAQKMELIFFNKMNIFLKLQEELEAEAAKRKITLKTYNSNYHQARVRVRKNEFSSDEQPKEG